MTVMNVRKMGVRVRDGQVSVRMSMGLVATIGKIVLVLMMLVMTMTMSMFDEHVRVFVHMSLTDV
jgi:hypothetical protein